ncbi:uncharacterized protein PV06_11825, partial [Exophiala oligosperma]
MNSASCKDHAICGAIKMILAVASCPNAVCPGSCLDDFATQECRDHPNWKPFIKKLYADIQAFLEAIASVSDVGPRSEDERQRSTVLGSLDGSGCYRPRSSVGVSSNELESPNVENFSINTRKQLRSHCLVGSVPAESSGATIEDQQSRGPGIENVPRFLDDDIRTHRTKTGLISECEGSKRIYRSQTPRSTCSFEPTSYVERRQEDRHDMDQNEGGNGEILEIDEEHHGLSQTGEGFSAQKQVGLRTDYENGDSEEVVDISEIGNISENGTNNRNANNNVTVETQVEDERRVRKDKRGRDDVQTNNVKVPEGLSDSSRARMKHVVRSSNKRSIHTVGPETPTKKPRGTGSTSTTQLQSAASATTGSPTDQSYWEEWDMKREPHTSHVAHTTGTIKAIRLWDRFCRRPGLSFANSAYPQGVSPHRVNILVTMVLAVGNSHGFGALKRAMVAVQQGGAPSTADVFSNEPQRLVRTLTAIDTAGEMYGYMRRFALARLAKLYRSTTANAGRLVTNDEDAWISRRRPPTKVDKAKAYCSMIEHIWDTAFPDHYKGQAMTKSGLIDSNAPDAARWNQCKRKLSKQIEAGQRWLS